MLRNDKKDTRAIITTRGMLSIVRTVLRPADKSGLEKLIETENVKCVVPLDIVLGIDALPFKMTREMMCEVAFWAQNQCSYKAAEEILKKVYGVGIASETIRKITDYVGKAVFERDTANADYLMNNVAKLEYSGEREGVLYIQMDGAALNTRHKNNDGSTWRENKLGMVFSGENIQTYINSKGEKVSKILKKEYTSYIGSANEFKKYVFAVAAMNGYGKYKTTVVLGDGAAWIRNMCAEVFPDAVQILDLFHLCENIYEYAKAIFKNDEKKYKPWADEVIDKFKTGKKAEALEQIGKFKSRELPGGVVNLFTYTTNNIDRTDYAQYAEKGYYVGSGAIESGNKVVLQKRLKLAGMRWNEQSAQYLLSLRAKFESNLWPECVVNEILSCDFTQKRQD